MNRYKQDRISDLVVLEKNNEFNSYENLVQIINIKLFNELNFNQLSKLIKKEYIILLDSEHNNLIDNNLENIIFNIKEYRKRALDIVFLKISEKKQKQGYLDKDKRKLFAYNNNSIILVRKEYLLKYIKDNELKKFELKNFEVINRVLKNDVIYIDEIIADKLDVKNNFNGFYNQFEKILDTLKVNEIKNIHNENLEEAIKYLLREYIKEKNNVTELNFKKIIDLLNKIFNFKKDFKLEELLFLNQLIINNDFNEFNSEIWYKLYKKSVYKVKIFETYNSSEKIVYGCAWLVFMKSKEDREKLNQVKFYLYDEKTEKRICLEKVSSERSFYKFDYPHEEFLYPEDNFRLQINKKELKTGNFKLMFDFLGEKGEFIIANFSTTRKFLNEIYRSDNQFKLIRYNVFSKNFNISIKACEKNIFNKIKLKKQIIESDLANLNNLKFKNYNIKNMYFLYPIKKRIQKKPIILIGEMPNTYEDSGSVLFEELLKNNREYDVYFVTVKEELLKRDRRFVEFGSKQHKDLFLLADILINVQNIDLYMNPFIKRNENLSPKKHSKDNLLYLAFSKYLNKQKKIFLQHGVLYQSGLTNGIYVNADFDYLVVSAEFEKKIFPEGYREVIESGLPRFSNYDKDGYKIKSKKILFSPTWRKYLKDMKNGEIKLDEIINSEYYKRIISFLTNEELIEFLEENNYELIYNVHHTLRELVELDLKNKKLSKFILIKSEEESLNKLIKECDICITDYSSLFFDFLWQGKPVINYVYDYEDFHFRKDNNKKLNEYFNLLEFNKKNIAMKEEEVIKKLKIIIENEELEVNQGIFMNRDSLNNFTNELKYLK